MVQVDVLGNAPCLRSRKYFLCVPWSGSTPRSQKIASSRPDVSEQGVFLVPAVHRAIKGQDPDCDQVLEALGPDVVVKAQPLEDDTLHVQDELPDLRWLRSVGRRARRRAVDRPVVDEKRSEWESHFVPHARVIDCRHPLCSDPHHFSHSSNSCARDMHVNSGRTHTVHEAHVQGENSSANKSCWLEHGHPGAGRNKDRQHVYWVWG